MMLGLVNSLSGLSSALGVAVDQNTKWNKFRTDLSSKWIMGSLETQKLWIIYIDCEQDVNVFSHWSIDIAVRLLLMYTHRSVVTFRECLTKIHKLHSHGLLVSLSLYVGGKVRPYVHVWRMSMRVAEFSSSGETYI